MMVTMVVMMMAAAAVVGGVEVAAGEGGEGGEVARGASEYGHRVDREMGSIFDFGRNARRKIIPVAGGGGRRRRPVVAGNDEGDGERDIRESEDISRNNIPGIKFNKWEELAGELMR
ncbi:hypothetical protein Tco_0033026 [Tanacetum coccineum]